MGKNSQRSCRISREGALHRKGEGNSRVVPPFPESPRCLSPFQGNFFPYTASTFRTRIDSHNGGTWDSPLGKPRGKATDPLIHAKGIHDSAAAAREESARACPHSRRGLTSLGRFQKYTKIHVSTGEESLVSGPNSTQGFRPRHRRERNPVSLPEQLPWGLAFPEATRAGP